MIVLKSINLNQDTEILTFVLEDGSGYSVRLKNGYDAVEAGRLVKKLTEDCFTDIKDITQQHD
jgi:hypothetical protein